MGAGAAFAIRRSVDRGGFPKSGESDFASTELQGPAASAGDVRDLAPVVPASLGAKSDCLCDVVERLSSGAESDPKGETFLPWSVGVASIPNGEVDNKTAAFRLVAGFLDRSAWEAGLAPSEAPPVVANRERPRFRPECAHMVIYIAALTVGLPASQDTTVRDVPCKNT